MLSSNYKRLNMKGSCARGLHFEISKYFKFQAQIKEVLELLHGCTHFWASVFREKADVESIKELSQNTAI